MIRFSEVLKELRIEKHLTQEELGKVVGVSDRTIGMYEQRRREPDFETLNKIANYFNVQIDYLMGEKQKLNSSPNNNKYVSINNIEEKVNDWEIKIAELKCAINNELENWTGDSCDNINLLAENIKMYKVKISVLKDILLKNKQFPYQG